LKGRTYFAVANVDGDAGLVLKIRSQDLTCFTMVSACLQKGAFVPFIANVPLKLNPILISNVRVEQLVDRAALYSPIANVAARPCTDRCGTFSCLAIWAYSERSCYYHANLVYSLGAPGWPTVPVVLRDEFTAITASRVITQDIHRCQVEQGTYSDQQSEPASRALL
jgi:hypothetical protein